MTMTLRKHSKFLTLHNSKIVDMLKIIQPIKQIFTSVKNMAIDKSTNIWECSREEQDIIAKSCVDFSSEMWQLRDDELDNMMKSSNFIVDMVEMCRYIRRILIVTIDSMWNIMSSLSRRGLLNHLNYVGVLSYLINIVRIDPNSNNLITDDYEFGINFISVRSSALILKIISSCDIAKECFVFEKGIQTLLIGSNYEIQCGCCVHERAKSFVMIMCTLQKYFKEYEKNRIEKMQLFVMDKGELKHGLNDDLLFRINGSLLQNDDLLSLIPFCVVVISDTSVSISIHTTVCEFLCGNIEYKNCFNIEGGSDELIKLKNRTSTCLELMKKSKHKSRQSIQKYNKLLEKIDKLVILFNISNTCDVNS